MMYLVFVKVCYDWFDIVMCDKWMFVMFLVFNWVIGLVLMFMFVWVFLGDLLVFCIGLIIVGFVCCIVMVIIWNDLLFWCSLRVFCLSWCWRFCLCVCRMLGVFSLL